MKSLADLILRTLYSYPEEKILHPSSLEVPWGVGESLKVNSDGAESEVSLDLARVFECLI